MSPQRSNPGFWPPLALGGGMVLTAALLWQGFAAPRSALAQVPDSGAQRNAMIKELQAANTRLREISGLLKDIRDLEKAAAKKADKEAPPPRRP